MGDRLWAGIPPRYVTSQLGQLSLASLLTGWGKGGNVTSAGWQVILCDPIWHVSSCSGEACGELLYPVTYLLTYITSNVQGAPIKNNPLGKIHYLSYYKRFFSPILQLSQRRIRPHMQQISSQYLLWFKNYNHLNLKVQFSK